MSESLAGQWLGRATSENTNGIFLLELDRLGDHYEGWGYVWDFDKTKPGFMAHINATDESLRKAFAVTIQTINPQSADPMTPEQAAGVYPGVVLPTSASAVIRLDGDVLNLDITTNIPTTLSATAPRSQADQKSNLVPLASVTSWAAFKEHISRYNAREFIFRGQSETRRLRTSFHRSGRADLRRFISVDVAALHRNLSSRTKHIFNLERREEYGAFISLAQHHGYPTPLLDWTYSPYIAAFFAYRRRWHHSSETEVDRLVRIYAFNVKAWLTDFQQVAFINPSGPHFSALALLAIDNDRLVPQQSVSTVTNIDDIETYIAGSSLRTGHQYLEAVDLPIAERPQIMQELAMMGITAGSLMPGLDGACEELRELYFPKVM